MLKISLDNYEGILNNILPQLGNEKRNNQFNDGVIPLWDKFVKIYNIANWVVYDTFISPGARIYVDKLNESVRSKPIKTS